MGPLTNQNARGLYNVKECCRTKVQETHILSFLSVYVRVSACQATYRCVQWATRARANTGMRRSEDDVRWGLSGTTHPVFLSQGLLLGGNLPGRLSWVSNKPKIHLPLPPCTGITSVCQSFFFFFLLDMGLWFKLSTSLIKKQAYY